MTTTINDFAKAEQRAQWLHARKAGIGGSDAAAACGLSPWKSPIELWLEKTGTVEKEDEESEVMYWGTTLESVVCNEFAKRTGLEVLEPVEIRVHPEYPWMIANLDRVIIDENENYGVLEAKTANAFTLAEWQAGEIPIQYQLQMAHYLAVTGYSFGYFACLVGGQHYFIHRVDRDDALIESLIKLESDFWSGVVNNVPPAIDGSESCSEFLKKLFPESNGEIVQLDAKFEKIIEDFEEVKRTIKELEAVESLQKNLLINELGAAEIGIVNGRTITYKSAVRNTLDTKAIQADYPELATKYNKQSSYRTLLVKKAK
jgi:putative phage-type endonuclease